MGSSIRVQLRFWCLAVAIMAGAFSQPVRGQVTVFSDGFEYADQAAFEVQWPAVSGTTTGTLSTNQAKGGSKSIFFPLTPEPLTPVVTRNQHDFPETLGTAAAPVIFRFDFFDSAGTAAAYRQFVTILDGPASAAGQLISLGLNNNITSNKYMARVLGSDGGSGVSAFFQLNDAGSPNRSTGWHELMASITPSTIDFYVDGILSKSIANPNGTRSFDAIRIGSGLTSTQTAYVDNVFVGVGPIPEPGSLAVLGIAGLGLLSRQRRT